MHAPCGSNSKSRRGLLHELWGSVLEYTDLGHSGAKASSPALDALRRAAKAGEVRQVMVFALDRLGRWARDSGPQAPRSCSSPSRARSEASGPGDCLHAVYERICVQPCLTGVPGSPYRSSGSYGTPSAAGALALPTNPASSSSVRMYGSASRNPDGT